MLNKRVASFYTGAVSVLMEIPNPKESDGNYTTLIIVIISILVLLIVLCFVFFFARKRRKNNEEKSIQRVDEQNLLESN
jgi:heme/copper-type cytochrome/quinol oxidase subunit 2